MTKTAALIMIILLRLIYQPSAVQNGISPFTSQLPLATKSITSSAQLISIKGSVNKGKAVIEWTVSENETADQFEVEKSADGKNFTLAALVFGNDLPATGNYKFFEKAAKTKVVYRIKLISKNKQAEYSPMVEINPGV